ncbi:MAG: agmatine deiminase family protein [Candidatus Cloacimonetes bacterium]|nr:agmatine deiminase family protein [Candidatus Cloacimonadota bacterium]
MRLSLRILIVVIILCSTSSHLCSEQLESEGIPYIWENRFTQTPPPPSPVRPIAEFEPASHVMIRYPLGIPLELVVLLAETTEVICLVSSSSQQNSAINSFTNAGANMDRVSFMIASTDSYWIRDYAPWFIIDGNYQYAVVDFQYNRPRPGDNMVPQIYANNLELNYYGMNLQQTGGNYMTDGINTAAQTQIAYSENGNNANNVNNLMEQYLGITNYHVVQDPNNTYIDHIDCWAKFLAPDKILIRSVPSSHPQYDEIEEVVQYFASQNCAWGYPYKIYRVNTPQNQPYTNSLILNKRVFVPQMNSSYDAAALDAYASAMPGYEIIGVTGAYYSPWESTDALHCRTHEIPDESMLYIAHNPYHGIQSDETVINFDALIIPYSNSSLYPDSLYVAYSINDIDWQYAPLVQQNGYLYRASISSLDPGDVIRYYIRATDMSGRTRFHPEFAELDPHQFSIFIDNQAPNIVHNTITSIGEEETTFVARIDDESGINRAWIEYCIDDNETQWANMIDAGNTVFLWSYNPNFSQDQQIFNYRILAEDMAGNTAHLPLDGTWYNIPVNHSGSVDSQAVPAAVKLETYPNPLRIGQELSIKLQQPVASALNIQIFNVKGQLVFENNAQDLRVETRWDGRDKYGNKSPSGLYFIRINGAGFTLNRKLIIAL